MENTYFIPCVRLRDECQTANLAARPWQSLERDWFGKPAAVAPDFRLAANSHSFWFEFRVNFHDQAPHFAPAEAGAFVEGLWEHDVAELFLRNPQSGQYQEFNFAPSGAWWSVGLESYRQRSSGFVRPDVEYFFTLSKNIWMGHVRVPFASLWLPLVGQNDLQANVSFIVGHPEQRFYSFGKAAGNPDFHLAQIFCPIEWEKNAR